MTRTRRTSPARTSSRSAQLPTSIWLPGPNDTEPAPTAPAVLPAWAIDKIRAEFSRHCDHIPAALLRIHIHDTAFAMDARTPCTTYIDPADDEPDARKPVLLAELHPDTLPAPGDLLNSGPMPGAIDDGWPGFFVQHGDTQGATGSGAVYCGDARRLAALLPGEFHGLVDLVVTSPPYGASVHGQVRSSRETGEPGVVKTDYRYSRDPNNLAHVGLDDLLTAFTVILIQCRHALRPGGHAVITTRPWRERGELVDLPSAVLAAGQAAGLIPVERCAALLAGIRDGRLVARPSFFQMKNVRDARRAGLPLAVIQHEDTLVLKRPAAPRARCEPMSATGKTAWGRTSA